MKPTILSRTLPLLLKSRSGERNFREAMALCITYLKTYLYSLSFPLLFLGIVGVMVFYPLHKVVTLPWMLWLFLWMWAGTYLVAIMRQCIMEITRPVQANKLPRRICWKKEWKNLCIQSFPAFVMMLMQILFFQILFIVSFFLNAHLHWVWIPFLIVGICLIVPFNIMLNVRQFGHQSFFNSFKVGWVLCRHYAASQFLLFVMFFFVFLFIVSLCLLPLFILNMAVAASDAALEVGDPSDLPSFIYILQYILVLLLMPLAFCSLLAWILPQYFHYFSMLQGEKNYRKRQRILKATREVYAREHDKYYTNPPRL